MKRITIPPGVELPATMKAADFAAMMRGAKPKIKNENHTRAQLRGPKPQRNPAPALDAADGREKESVGRTVVRFIGYRVRPLDPDNFAGGCKDLLDGLRHAQLILGDEPWRIRLETEQVKVSHYFEQKTVIEIEDRDSWNVVNS